MRWASRYLCRRVRWLIAGPAKSAPCALWLFTTRPARCLLTARSALWLFTARSASWLFTATLLVLVCVPTCVQGKDYPGAADIGDTVRTATDSSAAPAVEGVREECILPLEAVLEKSLGLEMDQDLFDRLNWLRDHPIDINTTDMDALLSVPGVSPAGVDAIGRHRRKHGPFKETFDLAGIEGVTGRTWELLRPFVTVSPRRLALLDYRGRTVVSLQNTREDESAYLGSAAALYSRVILSPSTGWESGLVFLADRGERVSDGFLSGYVQHESPGLVRRLILGDFVALAGLGLMWGQGLRRDASVAGTVSGHLSPHRSSAEVGFVRGIGATLALPVARGEARLHVLASYTPCPATLDADGEITSLAAGGALNTTRTLERKNAAYLTSFGGRLEFLAPGNLRLGLTAQRSWFDHCIRADWPHEIAGRDFGSIGVDAVASAGPARCALEYAVAGGEIGMAASIEMNLGRRSATHILFRHCAPGFHSLFALGGGFGDATRNTNEVRWSLDASPSGDLDLQCDVVQYRKPWRSATEPFPVGGKEIAFEADLRPAKGFQVNLRGEERWNEHVMKAGDSLRPATSIATEPHRRLQCTGSFARGGYLRLRGRIDLLRFLNPATGSEENGWMASGDVHWEPARWLAISARMTVFACDSYESRLYAVESTVDGLSGSKLLTGTGRRWYWLLVCRPLPSLRFSARYASTDLLLGARSDGGESQLILQVDFEVD
jgi:hypothetical protein